MEAEKIAEMLVVGVNRMLEEKDERIRQLEQRVDFLERLIEEYDRQEVARW